MIALRSNALAPTGFVTDRVRGVTHTDGQRAAFAAAPIEAGEVVAVWGGEVIDGLELATRAGSNFNTVQVEEGLYLTSTIPGPADWINHSCDPNLGIRGQIVLVAMRPIAAGEELAFDYAMTDGSDYDVFDCACGAPLCRGRIDGNGWMLPELQARYRGFFSDYLARRIAR
jgi:hypothetical protein